MIMMMMKQIDRNEMNPKITTTKFYSIRDDDVYDS